MTTEKRTTKVRKPASYFGRMRLVLALVAGALIVGALVVFIGLNYNRIEEQNLHYLEGSTQQVQERVNDVFSNALYDIQLVARVFENTASPVMDSSGLHGFLGMTSFDSLSFVDADGTAVNQSGQEIDVTGEEFFTLGMAGNVGFSAYAKENPARLDEGMVFYAPVRSGGKVVGLVTGWYNEATMREVLTSYFFGEQTTTYLCDREGYILARSSVFSTKAETVFDIYNQGTTQAIDEATLAQALQKYHSASFSYDSSAGEGLAYVMPLSDFDLLILDTFPASITATMAAKANWTAFVIVVFMLVVFGAYAVYLVWEARQRNSELLLENRRATGIIDASTSLFKRFVMMDLQNNTYEYLKNEGARGELLPRGPIDEFHKHWRDSAVDRESRQAIDAVMDRTVIERDLTPEVPFLQHEYRVFHNSDAGGEVRWLQSACLCLERNDDGVPVQVMLAIQDVTDIKSEERRTREAVEEAYHAATEASAAKSNFLNAMSHDIRTPMNSIMGLTSIALMNLHDSERVRDCLSKITTASQHLLVLLNEVLDMAKIESGTIVLQDEDFNLAEMVDNLMATAMPQAAAKGQLLTLDAGDIKHEYVEGDVMRLQQALGNVLANAVKFTGRGGTIRLRIDEKPSHLREVGCFEFTVTDTGSGISPDLIEHIFEPFTRGHDSRTSNVLGSGLGLPIAKTIVDMMNGSIEVQSEEGVGSTFKITVFLRLSDAAETYLEDIGGARILVADDDKEVRDSLQAMLQDFSMEPVCVASGEEAVFAMKQAQREGNPFHAAILDWRMPGMSGLETSLELKNLTSDQFPIGVVSGYDLSAVEDEAAKAGVKAFITKPVFKTRLAHGLRELLSDGIQADVVDEAELLRSCDCSGRRILLAEDNALAAAIAIEVIGQTNAEIEHAENGERAVEMLLEHEPGYYDMVFTDIQMPIMNGYEATKTIRKHGRTDRADLMDIPIVALTADAFSDDKRNAELAGMNAHMSKPLSIPVLVKMLNQYLRKGNG